MQYRESLIWFWLQISRRCLWYRNLMKEREKPRRQFRKCYWLSVCSTCRALPWKLWGLYHNVLPSFFSEYMYIYILRKLNFVHFCVLHLLSFTSFFMALVLANNDLFTSPADITLAFIWSCVSLNLLHMWYSLSFGFVLISTNCWEKYWLLSFDSIC